MEKGNVSADMLSGIKAAESSLARGDMRNLVDSLPDGHPLKEEAKKHSDEMGGDLNGLPDGHPLIVQWNQAKERYERQVSEETVDAQDKTREIRKARKLDAAKKRRDSILQEEHQAGEHRDAATDVNKSLDGVTNAIRQAYKVLSEHEEKLNKSTISRARVTRLKRLLFATERGLSGTRMNRG